MLRKFAKPTPGATPLPLSIIGTDVRVIGDIITEGEMQIDGRVDGDITCKTLVIGPDAHIAGEIKTATVHIHGEVAGRLTADHVTIGRTGKVTGDICHGTLEIHSGAQVEGHFLRKGAEAPPAALPKPAEKGNGAAVADEVSKPAKAKAAEPIKTIEAAEAAEALAADETAHPTVN